MEFENFEKLVKILNQTGVKLRILSDEKDIFEISAENREININIVDIDDFVRVINLFKQSLSSSNHLEDD